MFYLVASDGLRREGWKFMANSWYGNGPIVFFASEYVEEARPTLRHKFRDIHAEKRVHDRPFVEPPECVVNAFREWLSKCPIFLSKEDSEKQDAKRRRVGKSL